MNDSETTMITLLTNLTRDVGQIKTDLAVNTTKTGFIEEHLRTLNGKVIKQEEKQQNTDTALSELVKSKRRWDDGWRGASKQAGLFVLGIVSAYIIKRYF